MTRFPLFALIASIGFAAALPANADVVADYAPLSIVRAEHLADTGRYDAAVEVLNTELKRLRSNEYRVRALGVLCRSHLMLEQIDAAADTCGRAADSTYATWSDVSNRGAVAYLTGKYEAALADFRRAADMNPKAEEISQNIAAATARLNAGNRLAVAD